MRAFLCLFVSLAAMPAMAGPLLYRVADADSEIWLLGSVHALRSGDNPLDARIEAAYDRAERVVLEVSPAELDPVHLARVALPLARYADGGNLADVFTREEYARLRQRFSEVGIDVNQLRDFEPWFVALQLFALNLARSDYASAEGVDAYFAARAVADGKETGGLETAAEQFGMFDSLPVDTQKAFLLDSADDIATFEQEMAAIVTAWRNGDEAALTRLLTKEFSTEPELREALLDARNRRWVVAVEDLLAQPGDTLLVVGALHLVGESGLANLLEEAGHSVEKR